jgi:lipopolysaccharide export system protein LptA
MMFADMTRHLTLLALLAPALAWGLTSDRDKPIQIAADRATLDEKTGIGIYEGNVHMHQGTLQLRGSKMTVKLARFSQRPADADTDQQAEAGHIEYHAREQRLILQGNANIRQQGREEFSSDRIEFNLRDNTVNAGGSNGDGRVHIILQPDRYLIEQPDDTAE